VTVDVPETAVMVGAAIADPLGAAVRSLFGDLRHAGELGADAAPPAEPRGGPRPAVRVLRGEAGRRALGTHVRFSLQMGGQKEGGCRVLQVRYRAYGCPYTLAACEWLARRLSGAVLPQCSAAALAVAVGAPPGWARALDIPADRLGRLLIIEDALHAAVAADSAVTKAS
jgi:hypothetical protein